MDQPERKASRTAIGVATLRALHELYDDSPKILSDPIIPHLLDHVILEKAKSNLEWQQDPVTTALRSHVVLRSRYAEDYLCDAVARGVQQYVSLGSGFDTFAYRQPKWAAALHIFEVDHAASQSDKIERLRRSGITIPPNVEFVAADFESASLRRILANSSLDLEAPAFFSCLGVLVYLTENSVRSIFAFVASFPRGSELVLSFSQGHDKGGVVKSLADASAAVGEPWNTYHTMEELTQQLMDSGFSEVLFLTPEEAEVRYYRDRQDNLPPPKRVTIARALV